MLPTSKWDLRARRLPKRLPGVGVGSSGLMSSLADKGHQEPIPLCLTKDKGTGQALGRVALNFLDTTAVWGC